MSSVTAIVDEQQVVDRIHDLALQDQVFFNVTLIFAFPDHIVFALWLLFRIWSWFHDPSTPLKVSFDASLFKCI